jgi:hypothetical protein
MSGSEGEVGVVTLLSTLTNTVQKPNSYKICCQSSAVFPLGYTDSVSTKNNSGQTRKYKSKKRHSQKLTAKPAPNSARKIRVYPDHKLNQLWRQMLTWSHYRFQQLLASMSDKHGVIFVEMNEAYTSKT